IKEGKLGQLGLVKICCYYHMRANDNPPKSDPPDFLDYEMWTGPAPLREYDSPKQPTYGNERVPHRRWWRTFMEYGNGITGDMCIHMLDMMFLRIDMPGCIRHKRGETFSEIYLSYLGGPEGLRIPPSEFYDVFPPERKFTYRSD